LISSRLQTPSNLKSILTGRIKIMRFHFLEKPGWISNEVLTGIQTLYMILIVKSAKIMEFDAKKGDR
jgi:hypothetical protein